MAKARSLYILCGGESRRMGTDKAQLLYQGKPFADRLYSQSQEFFDSVILLRGENSPIGSYQQIPDAYRNVGPLGGLLSAMRHSQDETIAVISVDLPLLTDETLRLLAEKEILGYDVMVAKSTARVQPLVGLYRTDLAEKLTNNLDSGNRSVMNFLKLLRIDYFEVTEQEIRNINTVIDYNQILR